MGLGKNVAKERGHLFVFTTRFAPSVVEGLGLGLRRTRGGRVAYALAYPLIERLGGSEGKARIPRSRVAVAGARFLVLKLGI